MSDETPGGRVPRGPCVPRDTAAPVPNLGTRSPDAVDPRSRWHPPSEQLLLLFDRVGVEPETEPAVLQRAVDVDALNAIGRQSTAVVTFELWGYWVRITPEVIELYEEPT
ncbi:hypothetical protein [Halobaculum sp. EA56]|uniref:hypothetical protein n=1 Tax=Halobaculum sp. EA56 TaxID=3421648 RepID=UPI003EB999D7